MAPESSPLTFDGVRYPQIPVLVISGEFDDQTSVVDGAAAAARFSHARHIVITNSFHVNALPRARSDCAARLVRRFMSQLEAGDAACAAAVPPVRLVTRFARQLHELMPAKALEGNEGNEESLRAVTATLLTCADVITRAAENGAGHGMGLRGGTYAVAEKGEGYRITLNQVRWTTDLPVSGRIDWPGRSGTVRAVLEVQGPHASGRLELSWPENEIDARARARGTLNDKVILAEAPAP